MYKLEEYVVKNGSGVCKVDNIVQLDMAGIDRKRLYYMLVPIDDVNGKIYVPVDNSSQQLRRVISKKEAYELLDKISSIQEIMILNDKLREQKYKEVIKNYDPESLLRILKTTYLRKEKRLKQGKKSTTVDEYYMSLAEKLLFSEMCLVLDKDKEEVHNLITESVNKE